jgi:23S rRNA (adenine2030-N6)-methyltransferase
MLSYQHAYHAGNLADVHKHALLCAALDYLTRKDKPLSFIETHAGRGLYALDAAEARKTGEAALGIARMRGRLPPDHPYARVLSGIERDFGPTAYPGSPLIAARMLRPGDRLHVAELHPAEHAALCETLAPYHVVPRREDGFAMALSVCPPTPRRGLLLVDPSYEVKADYAAIPRFLATVARCWNVGVLILWYPLLTSDLHAPMLEALTAQFPEALRHEVRFPPVRPGHGMTGSGLFVVNPPFGLADTLRLLDDLFATLRGG